jgi:hypothetical protein
MSMPYPISYSATAYAAAAHGVYIVSTSGIIQRDGDKDDDYLLLVRCSYNT